MNEQSCRYCDGELHEQPVTRLQQYEGHWVLIENVPALVCAQCGEQYFTPAAHDLVVDIVTGKRDPVRVEVVEVFDAGSVA